MAKFEVIAKSKMSGNRVDVKFDILINDNRVSTFMDLVTYLYNRIYKYLDQDYLYDRLATVFAKTEKELKEKLNKEVITSINQMQIFVKDNRSLTAKIIIDSFNKHMETILTELYKDNANNKPVIIHINETRHTLNVRSES